MLNIADRFIIHFFASAGVMLSALFAFRMAQRKLKYSWLPEAILTQLIVLAIVIFAVSALREAVDVSHGQTVTKAIFDYVSWAGGCGCSAWGIYRVAKEV